MMEKRTIIAIILTFIIIVAWGAIQSKYFPQEPSKPETKEVRRKLEKRNRTPVRRRSKRRFEKSREGSLFP